VSSVIRESYNASRFSHISPMPSTLAAPIPRAPHSPLHPHTPSSDPTPTSRSPPFRTPSLIPTRSSTPAVSSTPIITARDLAYLRALSSPRPIVPPIKSTPQDPTPLVFASTSIHPSLNIYISDLFSATRHHPELDGTLLTLRSHKDAEDLARAFRVIGGNTLGVDLLTQSTDDDSQTSIRDATTTTSSEEEEDESLGWGDNTPGENEILMPVGLQHQRERVAIRVVPATLHGPPGPTTHAHHHANHHNYEDHPPPLPPPPPPPQVWDVSEVDIARIFPRIVSHRLKVRDGPDDEVLGSIMFPAAAGASVAEKEDGETNVSSSRRTVKDILVNILASV